jgi:hypothetical protein
MSYKPQFPGLYDVRDFGAKIDGVTDDTAAVNAANSAINTAGGGTLVFPVGTCLITGHIVFPNSSFVGLVNPYSRQSSVRWKGLSPDIRNGQQQGPDAISAGTRLEMTYNGAGVAKIETYGLGHVELDHITFSDQSGGSLPFFYSTGTTPSIHDSTFSGYANKNGIANDQDAIILGGSTETTNTLNDPAAPFQGYDALIHDNFFAHIRRALFLRVYVAATDFHGNFISHSCGSNLTASVSAATNATTTVLTSTAHHLQIGAVYARLTFAGFTGNWAPLNGIHASTTVVDANTISVSVDSSTFGALTGTPVFYNGAAVELSVPSGMGQDNMLYANRIEMLAYAFGFKLNNSSFNHLWANDLEDAHLGTTIAVVSYENSATYNQMIGTAIDLAVQNEDATSLGTNTYIDSVAGFHTPNAVTSGNLIGTNTNGSQGTVVAQITTPATSTVQAPQQYGFYLKGKYWTGSASATDQWQMYQSLPAAGANPPSWLNIAHSGSSNADLRIQLGSSIAFFHGSGGGWGASGDFTNAGNFSQTGHSFYLNGVAINLNPSAGAATGSNNYAPSQFAPASLYWDGAASQADRWYFGPVIGTGSNPTTTFEFRRGSGTSGKVAVRVPALNVVTMPVYANNAAAVSGGLVAGDLYRTGADPDPVMIVH